MQMNAVQSLEMSQTFCKMTHHCITEDFACLLYCNQTINWIHLSCYSSCIGGRSRSNSGGGGGIGFPYIFFSPFMSSWPKNFHPCSFFAFVAVSRFLTVCLFLKLLHILKLLQVYKIFLLLFKEIRNNIVLLFYKPKEHLSSWPSECLGSLGCRNSEQLELVEKHAQRTSPCEFHVCEI